MQQETHGLIPVSEKLIGCVDVKPACTTVMPATILKGIPWDERREDVEAPPEDWRNVTRL